jgi:hypothetical protein
MSTDANEATIRIVFDGDAVQSGTMDVRAFAPALLALSDVLDEANKLLNGPDYAVQLRVKHDVRHGSFDIGLHVVQTLLSKILDLFGGHHIGVKELLEILGMAVPIAGATGVGLVKLVKVVRGRKVVKVEFVDGQKSVRLTFEGDDELVISRQVFLLFNDLTIRRAMSLFLAPLQRDGIDSLEVRSSKGTVIESVVKDELPVFEPPPPAEVAPQKIEESEFPKVYTIVGISFKEGNKWKVTDGQSIISVTIEDTDFLAKVDRHDVGFLKDDVIRCTVRQVQSMTSEGLKTETFIKHVTAHQHTHRQTVFPELVPPQDAKPMLPEAKKAKAPKAPEAKKGAAPKRRKR